MTQPNNQPLAIVGPYELIERIGAGGMGSVYRAQNTRDGRVVALKLMHEHVASDPSYAERFRREAAMAALIDSPNVVRVLEFASDGGRPYIVTEFVDGPSLEAVLQNGPMSSEAAGNVGIGVANALAAASNRNIVHRDIKPANILMAPDGTAKVTDFGIATLNQGSSLTVPGMFVGTAAYAAPEQHHGTADVRSDIYSLGVVLFELLTGTLPFLAETATGMMREHESGRIPAERLAGMNPRLATAIVRCLEKSPARRYQHPNELAQALQASLPVRPPLVAVGETMVAGVPSETVVAGPVALAPAGFFEDDLTRIAPSVFQTGEHTVAALMADFPPAVVSVRERVRVNPLLARALGAAAGVACITLLAMFGVRGGHSQEPPASGGGTGGSSLQPIDFGSGTSTPTVTDTATPTATSKKPRPGGTETATTAPIVTVTATNTPSPTVQPTKPSPTTPPPAPRAPELEVVDWAFCHQVGCPYGDQDLYAGYAIAIAFQFNQATSQAVSVEVWFDGEYEYTSNFSPSANGAYFDVLPYANYSGELEIDIYAGGVFVDSLWADVN